MTVRTVVHLVRHGEVHNPEGILYGRLPDYHLSDLGRAMAERLGEHFTGRDVVHVVASPLERAQETAAPVGRAAGLPVGSDGRLIEAGNWFEGKKFGVGDASLRNPRVWPHLVNPLRPSWGEAYVAQAARMHAAAEDARDRAMGHEAVLVSHQLPIWIARLAAEGRRFAHDPRRRQCSLASVTSLHYVGAGLDRVEYVEPAADLLVRASTVPGA